jgi:hypothetical protein
MKAALFLVAAVSLAASWFAAMPARAADACPSAARGAEREWSAQCLDDHGGERRVKPQYLKRLDFNRYGMATIVISSPRELLAVDRRGVVVVPNIRQTGDFDYPSAEQGVGRFAVERPGADGKPVLKCGYFKAERFSIVVPPLYDQCQPVHEGEGDACTDCVRYCTDADCHDSVFVGGKGVVLSADGKILRTYQPPSLDKVCGAPELASVRAVNGGATQVLTCKPGANSPFKM